MIFIGMERNGFDMNAPFFKYSLEEIKQMNEEDFEQLMEEHSAYSRKKFKILKESVAESPHFDTIEELRAYYHCMLLDKAINNCNKLFEN